MKEQLLNQLVNFVIAIVGILSTYVLAKLSQFLEAKKIETANKRGIDNYNRALQIAKGLYLVLEDEFKDIAKAGLDKKTEMDNRLLQLVPELSFDELNAINKQIWAEFNDKVVNVVTSPITVDVDANKLKDASNLADALNKISQVNMSQQ